MFCPKCRNNLISKNIDGTRRLICENCGYIFYINPLPVVAALCYRRRGEILLIKRGVPPAENKWALPTGFMEINETIRQGLLRELNEELNIKACDIRHIKILDVIQQKSSIYKSVIIIAHKIWLKKYPNIAAADDAREYKFYNLNSLPEIPFKSQKYLIKKFILR